MYNGKRLLLTFLAFLLFVIAAACSGDGGTGQSQAPETEPTSQPGETNDNQKDNEASQEELASIRNENIELFFAQTSSGSDQEIFDKDYGNKLKELLPNYTFTFQGRDGAAYEQLVTITKQQIDVLRASIGHTPTMVLKYDLQQDLSDLIEKYNFDLERLEPSTLEAQRQYDGNIYGIPLNTTSLALFYNKDLFDAFGVDYPQEGMTWDELYALAQQMTREHEGRQIRGMTMAFTYMLFLNQLSVPHFEPGTTKPNFTSDEFKKVFENFARFYRINGNEMTNGKYTLADQQDSFRENNTAMLMTLSTANFEDQINWDLIQLPFFEEKMGVGPQSYPTYLYIPVLTENRDAAFQVLMESTSEEYQRFLTESGKIPILKDSEELLKDYAKDNEFLQDKNIQAIIPKTFASPTEKTIYQGMADKHLLTALEEYAIGKDINTVLREAEERVNMDIAAEG